MLTPPSSLPIIALAAPSVQKRDLKAVGRKFLHVMIPHKNKNDKRILQDWDLWGKISDDFDML